MTPYANRNLFPGNQPTTGSRKEQVTSQNCPRISQIAKPSEPLAPLPIQQQISPPETPRQAPITPLTARRREEPDTSNQSLTGRSRTTLSETPPGPLALPIQQQISLPETPRRAPITPLTARRRQEPDTSNQSMSLTGRSTTLSETAEVVAGAMSSQINGDDNCYPPGGFRDFLARPLSHDSNSLRELSELREENSRLQEEITMLRSQLNSCVRNQPGKVQIRIHFYHSAYTIKSKFGANKY